MDELYSDMQNKGLINSRRIYPDSWLTQAVKCKENWNKIRMDLVCSVPMGAHSQLVLWTLAQANWN